jgi:hypothetical protein
VKRYFQFMIAVCLLCVGCATHYYKINSDRVNLYLRMPEAKVVYFSTSLDEFALNLTKKLESGIWEVAVPATREFTYFYKVDDVVYLPDCKLREKDDFGGENCLFTPDM